MSSWLLDIGLSVVRDSGFAVAALLITAPRAARFRPES
jgi:hypothetical protein